VLALGPQGLLQNIGYQELASIPQSGPSEASDPIDRTITLGEVREV